MVFHVDVNSAFLSWTATEMVKRGEPDLRLVPSCIGGDPSSRTSIVAAKSIPAKQYGITTGEPVSMALRKCPHLIVARSDFDLYVKCSKAFKAICAEYTPVMESFSIDEVFLDMSGMENIYPDRVKTAHEIKDRIRQELGFTVNVGIGENKVCAKMASDFEKPDRVHTLYRDEIPVKMWKLPVRELFTCGKSSAQKLQSAGIRTIGQLANAKEELLIRLLGEKQGLHLKQYANGIDNSPVTNQIDDAKSYSAETTVDDNLSDLESINHILLAQADIVAARMRADDGKCSCVGVNYRTIEFRNKSHQRKLSEPTNLTAVIYETAKQLVKESWFGEPLRLVGLTLMDIHREEYEQISLFRDEKKEKLKMLDAALDSIRERYGNESIQRASTVQMNRKINRKYQAEQKNDRKLD